MTAQFARCEKDRAAGTTDEHGKHHSVTAITESMTASLDYARRGKFGETTMKTLLAGIAFLMAMAFASQAFALPYCPNGTWHGHYYVCASYDE